MIELFAFHELSVAVLGLGFEGRSAARALVASGAAVHAWDDDPDRRDAARADAVPIVHPDELDWDGIVTLVVEHTVPHGSDRPHAAVSAARAAGCEVVCDAELLARAQRDASYVAVVSRRNATAMLDLLEHVLGVSGGEAEVGGDLLRPLLTLPPLGAGGVYVLAMPPPRAELTVSLTFDCALLLDLGPTPWPPLRSSAETKRASRWVFHRQTAPKAAVVSADDPDAAEALVALRRAADQVLVPISSRMRVPGGVYALDGVLYDDTTQRAVPIGELPLDGDADAGVCAAGAYACATALGIPRHAAMASLRSYYLA